TGGTLAGGGTIIGNVINSGGTVAPADDPETLTIDGDYSQTSGLLKLLIAGTSPGQYDQLDVSGILTLGGTLEIDFAPGFTPPPGTSFDFFEASSIAPDSSFDGVVLPDSVQWDTSSLFTAGTATVVPEPSWIALFGLVGMSLLRRRSLRST